MAQQDFLEVQPGEKITAQKWNQMQRAAAASQVLRGGENIRIQVTPHGTILNSKHGGGFNHPWRVVASQLQARVYPGTVNGEYPSMVDRDGNIIRMDAKPPPYLDLSAPKIGLNDVGWIAIELKLKDDYRTIETARVVQCDFIVGSEKGTTNPFFFFGLPGIGNFSVRYPIARLQWFRDSQSLDIYQVAMFNLNHTCKPPAQQTTAPGTKAQSTLPRHFFFPA
jgi:hypothetical protein